MKEEPARGTITFLTSELNLFDALCLIQQRHGGPEAEEVALKTEYDLPLGQRRDDRMATKFFPRVDVGHVNLHDGSRQNGQGVPQGVAVMRPGASVDENGIDPLLVRIMDLPADRPFIIRLEGFDGAAQLLPQRLQFPIDPIEGDGPVLSRVPLPEHVQVDAVQHQNLLHPFSSSDSEPLRENSIFIFPGNRICLGA